MFPADYCSLHSPICAATVSTASPWRKKSMHAQMSAFLVASDPWVEECVILSRKLKKFLPEEVEGKCNREPTLPKDPRQWSRDDVAMWVQHVSAVHQLPSVQLDRFLMNGKALCLMTIEMFVSRVPLGGKLLYKDFQLRLSSALYS